MIGSGLGILASQNSASPAFAFGNALKTTNGTEFVNFPSGLSALNNATQASVHFWVNKLAGDTAIVGYNKTSTTRFGISPFLDGKVYFLCANGTNSFGSVSYGTYEGFNTLVSLVFDGTGVGNSNRLKGYINGVEQALTYTGTIPSSLSSTSSSIFRINSTEVNSTFGIGKYDEIVITTDLSTPTQILNYYNSGNGAFAEDCFTNIIAYWRCNQVDGDTTLIDSVGTATGTLNNFVAPYFVPFI